MNIDAFLTTRNDDWQELSTLMLASKGKLKNLDPEQTVKFSKLYRSICADLAFARREYAGDSIQYSLESMVSKSSSMLYQHRGINKEKILYFFTTGALASIAQRPRLLLASFLLLMVPWVTAAVWANVNPDNAYGFAPAGVESVIDRPSSDFELSAAEKSQASSEILTNNIRICFMAFAGGMLLGIGTVLTLLFNGITIGSTLGLTIEAGNGNILWQFVFPHGFLEISCIIVSGAAGLRLAMAMLNPGFRTRTRALREEGRQALASVLVVGVALFFCGIVEGTVSTSGVPPIVGLTIGLSLLVIFWGLIVNAGLRERRLRNEVKTQPKSVLAA